MRFALQCSDGTWLSAIDGGGILASHRGDPGWRETFTCNGNVIDPPLGDFTNVGTFDEGGPLVWGKYHPQDGPVRFYKVEFEAGRPSDGMRTRIRGSHTHWLMADSGWWGAECGGGGVISTNRLTSDHNSWNYFTIRDMDWALVQPGSVILGVGTDHNLYFRRGLTGTWTQLSAGGAQISAIAWTADGTLWALGTGPNAGRLYHAPDGLRGTGDNLRVPGFTGPIGDGAFLAITALPEGGLLGVGGDNLLYTIDRDGNFTKVPNTGSVVGVAALANNDFNILGIGTNGRLYRRWGLQANCWQGPMGTGAFLAITAMPDGNLLGVKADNLLYTIDMSNGDGNHTQVPDSGSVISVAF